MSTQASPLTDSLLDESAATTTRKLNLKQWLVAGVSLIFFVVVLVPFLVSEKVNAVYQGYDLVFMQQSASNENNLMMFLSAMNTNSYDISATTYMTTLPHGLQKDPTSPVMPFRIQVAQNAVVVNNNTANIYAPLSSKILLSNGTIAWYPFDTYDVGVELQVLTGATPFASVNATPVDAGVLILSPRSFDWKFETAPKVTDTGYYSLTVKVKRRFNLYIVLVFVGIWAVTFSVGYIGSCAVIWKRRPADNPIIFLSALFAVPTFRNTLPGKPPYGCVFDVACTYFSIAVIFTFLVLVSLSYMKKPKPPPPAEVV
ncbi:Aste57867_14616 [Aphanomyces stellatus]|uniref:Aste57867_14616 protein n=1 Tax=Aphanomyces stellatus TaxID=120398 RepID=A0A485L164_9STRA|nr:hypothetical protein As57867_014562 [Aphanomyces stellatus]VFT91435.1 Aste57867_14616 [Aphanomyces stellatus]